MIKSIGIRSLQIISLTLIASMQLALAQSVPVEVHFEQMIRPWDGFGFNYVEEAQYRDISEKRQDYGGFSYLDEESKQEILNLIFSDDGLRPGLVKMFLDPFHQET